MRKQILLFLFIFSTILLSAQSAADVFETRWEGGAQSRTDLTESGYFVVQHVLSDVDYNSSDDTFTGKLTTTFNLDGSNYITKTEIKGRVNIESASCKISHSWTLREDQLPGGLYWIHEDISLTIYQDDEHSGYYYLYGQSESQYYDDEYFLISNYPY